MAKEKFISKELRFLDEVYYALFSPKYLDLKKIAIRRGIDEMIIPLLIRKQIISEKQPNQFFWNDKKIKPNQKMVDQLLLELDNRKVEKTKRLSNITFNEFANKPISKHKKEPMKSEYDGRKTTVSYSKAKYLLKELREENPKLILFRCRDFMKLKDLGELPVGVPKMPHITYKGKGWKGWENFLSVSEKIEHKKQPRTQVEKQPPNFTNSLISEDTGTRDQKLKDTVDEFIVEEWVKLPSSKHELVDEEIKGLHDNINQLVGVIESKNLRIKKLERVIKLLTQNQ